METTPSTLTPTTLTDPTTGLTSAEVEARIAEGLINTLPPRSGRTTWGIIRSNVFTRINALLGTLFVLVMTTGSWINGAFGLLIFFNSIIGIVQELRAKRTLDNLALVGEAHPTVIRDGKPQEIEKDALVLGDIVLLDPGEQIIVDGIVREAAYLEVDESLLTGESDAIAKEPGTELMSGSFVSSGTGRYQATRIGADSYAAKLTAEASKFTLVHSELQSGIDKILKVITWVLIPVGIATIIGQITVGESGWRSIVLAVTGALVPMIPEGLVLITSTAFALGVIRLGRRNCLVNELPAIEGLARVDVVCADKTGTLTENAMTLAEVQPLGKHTEGEARTALRQLAGADTSPNSSMQAIIDGNGATGSGDYAEETAWAVTAIQPFTSAKKWSGMTFEGISDRPNPTASAVSWVLGAPDILLEDGTEAVAEAQEIASTGLRVLALGRGTVTVTEDDAPGVIDPVALIILEQKIRPDAGPTLEYFASQGVDVKVISGDNAQSVGAVTRSLGVETSPVDARTITEADWDDTIENNNVFGRVTPQQKRAMVASLQARGHTVAMTGDGVNDVLALKDADLGVAMGSGTEATRAVGKIVLLDDKFATLPHVVGEGRRVLGNIERVANLFLTKTIYSSIMAVLVLVFAMSYPFQPIHVTITGWFTIGIPAFLLSLPPNNERARGGFVKRVLTFGIPAGISVALASFITYAITTSRIFTGSETYAHLSADTLATQASTAALLALIIASTWVLATIARPYEWWKVALILLPLAGYGIIFNWSLTQHFFMLDSSNTDMMLIGTLAGGIAAVIIEMVWWIVQLTSGQRKPLWLPKAERLAQKRQRELM